MKKAEVNNPKSDFNFNLYADFKNMIKKQPVEQLSWGKDANVTIKGLENEPKWFWKYGKEDEEK